MYNNELYKIISQDKTVMMGFQGICSADELPARLQCDQSLIFNASDSDEMGSHWLCLYQNSNTELEMFDSFGNPPSFFNLQDKLPYSRSITYNSRKLQGVNSSVCGVYCMQYLFYKSRGYPTSKIVDDLFSADLDQNDRRTIDYIKTLYNYI